MMMVYARTMPANAPQHDEPCELVGLDAWNGTTPIILVTAPQFIAPIAVRCRRAHVVSLPAYPPLWITSPAAWAWWMRFYRADVSLWPVSALDVHLLAPIATLLVDAGVRVLRWVQHHPADWARYVNIETLCCRRDDAGQVHQ